MALPGLNLFDTLPQGLQYIAVLGAGAVAFLLAYAGADADSLAMGFGQSVAAVVLGAVAGFVLWDLRAALVFTSYALMVVPALQLFFLKREAREIPLWFVFFAGGVVLQFALSDVATAAFLAIGTVGVFSALKVVQSRELVHAVVWLAGVLAAIAAIFLTLDAEFLAAIQILIYVGAVVTLILFTVMLTLPSDEAHLESLELPPGVTVERIDDLQIDLPSFTGAGPMKDFAETNPRKPVRQPADLSGVAMADNVFAGPKTAAERIRAKDAKGEAEEAEK